MIHGLHPDLTRALATFSAAPWKTLAGFPSWGCQRPERSTPTVRRSSPSASSGPSTRTPRRTDAPCPGPPGRTGSCGERTRTRPPPNRPESLWSLRWSWGGARGTPEGRGRTPGSPPTWGGQRSGWGQTIRWLWGRPVSSAQAWVPPTNIITLF